MRKLKFRIYDHAAKAFMGGGAGFPIYECNYDNEISYQQFTGLLDKNEKEIFEGDIIEEYKKPTSEAVKWVYDAEKKVGSYQQNTEEFKEVGKIEWNNYSDGEYVENVECWMLIRKDGMKVGPISELLYRAERAFYNYIYTYKVIGNIFDNPEILK